MVTTIGLTALGQHCVDRVRHLLEKYGIERSMNRPGKCTDIAEVESFFKALKGELIKDAPIADLMHLRDKLRKYIEYFYNISNFFYMSTKSISRETEGSTYGFPLFPEKANLFLIITTIFMLTAILIHL
ncbi:integrase core domain-containing protein [Thaumasiovibrio subtropicus]|uniref:integrase core domain-containing protein n=2 Tax=Thaumasiovibrio subtropicus TaxID=1891207 RepID=UPI0039C9B630